MKLTTIPAFYLIKANMQESAALAKCFSTLRESVQLLIRKCFERTYGDKWKAKLEACFFEYCSPSYFALKKNQDDLLTHANTKTTLQLLLFHIVWVICQNCAKQVSSNRPKLSKQSVENCISLFEQFCRDDASLIISQNAWYPRYVLISCLKVIHRIDTIFQDFGEESNIAFTLIEQNEDLILSTFERPSVRHTFHVQLSTIEKMNPEPLPSWSDKLDVVENSSVFLSWFLDELRREWTERLFYTSRDFSLDAVPILTPPFDEDEFMAEVAQWREWYIDWKVEHGKRSKDTIQNSAPYFFFKNA